MEHAENTGSRFKEIRKDMRETQSEFAQRLGLSQGAVSTYEKGRLPDEQTLRKIHNQNQLVALVDIPAAPQLQQYRASRPWCNDPCLPLQNQSEK